ncbi:MAG: metal dependent phosphohydrolase [Parcubacteria group bacterium Gr01-1014_20]|nr:MAG: metal dependent phosphohydrolase [Parcubacteria group bacterium Gr01-1014_20]
MEKEKKIAGFLFEVGTMRKLIRMHRQVLLTDDLSDSIASHSYRVAIIGWFLAKEEKADPYKTVMMCLLHDMGEARTGDHNWIHKKYVKVFDEEIVKDQFGTLPYPDFKEIADEYEERKTKEAVLAKDADLLDQLLLLREYDWQGNKEAAIWLHGKSGNKTNAQLARLQSEAAKKIGEAIYNEDPSSWWDNLWTSNNRKD